MAQPTGTDPRSGERRNTPDSLEALIERHPDVDLSLSETEAGVVVERLKGEPEQLGEAWADLTAWADRNQRQLGATPKRGALEKEKLLRVGFGKNGERETFSPSMVRQPRELEQAVSAEAEAPVPPALESASDPLEPFVQRLPGRYAAQINREALERGLSVGDPSDTDPTARLAQAENALRSPPLLGDRLREWGRTYGEDAAREEALARKWKSPTTPLDRWEGVLPPEGAAWIRGRADDLYKAIGGKSQRALKEHVDRAKQRNAFGALDGVFAKWTEEKKGAAADVVALTRHVNLQREIAAFESAGLTADGASRQPAATRGNRAGLDGFAKENGHLFGKDRTNLIVNQAVAIQEEFRDTDPAVIQAVRDRHLERVTRPDGKGAYETQRLEHQWHTLAKERGEIATAGNQAKTRAALEDQRREWRQAGERLAEVAGAGQRQWDQKTHLDRCMNDCAYDIAITVAADQELLQRGQREAAKSPEVDVNPLLLDRGARAELATATPSGGPADGIGR